MLPQTFRASVETSLPPFAELVCGKMPIKVFLPKKHLGQKSLRTKFCFFNLSFLLIRGLLPSLPPLRTNSAKRFLKPSPIPRQKNFKVKYMLTGTLLLLALSDTFWLFNQTMNRAQKWFNSIFNSKQNLNYSFNQKFIQKFVQNIQFKILFQKLEKSDSNARKGKKLPSPPNWFPLLPC